MTQAKTANSGAGQARTWRQARRRVRVNLLNVTKYAALTAAGILLFRAGAAYALVERGYKAVGGEVFALFLPVIYYAVSAAVRDFIKDVRNGFMPNFQEDE